MRFQRNAIHPGALAPNAWSARSTERPLIMPVVRTMRSMGLLGVALAFTGVGALHAQISGLPNCGGNNQVSCSPFGSEFWNGGTGFCDAGLKPSKGDFDALFGNGGSCINDTRSTVSDGSWALWALQQQRNGIQGKLPINMITTLGTHNSFSNISDGDKDPLSADQYYSITDQLNMGARFLRTDPHYYFGQVRACHGSTNVECALQGVAPNIGVGAALVPIIGAINALLLTPISPLIPVIDAAVVAFTAIESAYPINNRYWAWTIREIGDWLNAPGNNKEVLIMEFSDEAGGSSSDTSHDQYINAPIGQYLGSKVFTPSDLANWQTNNNSSGWPSLQWLQQNGKQVIIFNSKSNPEVDTFETSRPNCTDSSGNTIPNCPFVHLGVNYITQSQPDGTLTSGFQTCTTTSPIYASNVPVGLSFPAAQAHGYWIETGEDRSLSAYFADPSTILTDPPEVTQAAACSVSLIQLDFLMSLGSAPGSAQRSGPDVRREAAIWSYEQNDYGTDGPAVMKVSPSLGTPGRWTSTSPGTALPIACKSTSGGTWMVSATAQPTDYYHALTACPIGASFSAPQTDADNAALLAQAKAANVTRVLLNYSAVAIPPTAVNPASIDAYMDRAGAPPDDQHFSIDGFPYISVVPSLVLNGSNLVSLDIDNMNFSLFSGPVAATMAYNQETAQTVPDGVYQAQMNSNPYNTADSTSVPTSIGALTTHVMEPTATSFSVLGSYGPTSPVVLAATVLPSCGTFPTLGDGSAITITGGVTFTDVYTPPGAGSPTTTTLGTIPINNYPSDISANNNGVLTALTGNVQGYNCAADNTVCASTPLAPGTHTITASYAFDSTYGSSAATPIAITVGGFFSPSGLSFSFAPGSSAPQTQTVALATSQTFSGFGAVAPDLPGGALTVTQQTGGYAVTVTPGSALPGTYQESLRFTSSSPALTVNVPVIVNIYGKTPQPSLSSLSFSSVNQSTPATQTLQVTYSGGGITAKSTASWLTAHATLSSATTIGTTQASVSVAVNPAGLPAGTYTGSINIFVPGYSTPLVAPVAVTLNTSITSGPLTTIATVPTGLTVTIDGSPYTTPASFPWAAGSTHSMQAASAPVALGTGSRAVFENWSTGSTSPAITISSVTPGTTYTANFTTQYQVSGQVQPACQGTMTPLRIWVNQNSPLNIQATPLSNTYFAGFTGSVNSLNPSQSISTINAPISVVANFSKTPVVPVPVTLATSPAGLEVTLDGLTIQTPSTQTLAVGSAHILAVPTPQASTGTRYSFSDWSDGTQSNTRSITVSQSNNTYTANFGTQYLLTTIASPIAGGTVAVTNPSADSYYPAGATETVTATPSSGYYFIGFKGVTGTSNVTTTTMVGPEVVAANFGVLSDSMISWAQPASITFGSALSAKQLNATANVPGTFVYTPAIGFVPPEGNGYTLSVTFTPTSPAYRPSTKTVTIDVLPAGVAALVVPSTMTRDPNTKELTVEITLANTGTAPYDNIVMKSALIGTTHPGEQLPTIPTLRGSGIAVVTLTYPPIVGASGTVTTQTISGTYTGGTFNYAARVVLP